MAKKGGWGGARPGSGPKPKVEKPAAANAVVTTAAALPQPFRMTQNQVGAAIALSESHARNKTKRPELNPFQLPAFPPRAIPPKKLRMAMDESMDWAGAQWGGGLIGGAAAEGLVFLGYPYLAELAQRPEYRVISETIATEMTRKWIKFTSVGSTKKAAGGENKDSDKKDNEKTEKIKELTDFLDHLQVRDCFADLATQDGFFGRSHLFLDDGKEGRNDAELKTPIGDGRDRLAGTKIGKGWLKAVRTVEAVWTYPTTYNAVNPLRPDWYNPQVWYVMGKEIHKSRLLTFIGRPVPDLLKPSYSFGGLSLSQMAKPYVDIWLTTRQSVADLIHSFSVMVLMTDVQTILSPGNANGLIARAALFNALRDNQGLMVVNKATEDFKNVSASLSGLHELQAQAQEHMASVARIPLVKFTGISPSGLNASSEGEMRAFYDTIAAYQNKFFRPNLNTLVSIAQVTLWGQADPDITYEFVPLWELSEKEKGEKRKDEAETAQIDIDAGAISPAERRKVLVSDPDSPYQGLNADDVPDLGEEEEQGLEPAGGRPDPKAGGEPDGGGAGPGPGGGGKEAGGEDAAVIPFSGGVDPLFAGDSDFQESDHPRAPDGKFGSGSGSSSSAGPSNVEKIKNAATMHGEGSPKHKQAIKQFSAKAEKEFNKALKEIGKGSPLAPGLETAEAKAKAAMTAGVGAEALAKVLSDQESHVLEKKHGSIEAALSGKKPSAGPLNPVDLKRVGEQMGTNPGGVFEDKDGKRFYVKQPQSKAHVRNELLAGRLYALAGSATLKYRPVAGAGHVATEMVPLDKDRASKLSPAEIKEAQQDFVVHAWLGNYDAVGTGGDNLGTVNGKPTALDLGGALAYRAQGKPKGDAFGTKVGEIDSMRDPKIAPDAAKVFGSMTQEQLKESAEKVTSLRDGAIRAAVKASGEGEEMADKLIARKADIAKRFGLASDEATFEEGKHPRAPDGKFASSGSGGGGLSDKEKQEAISSGSAETLDAIAKKLGYGGWTGSLTDKQKEKIIAEQDGQYAKVAAVKAGQNPENLSGLSGDPSDDLIQKNIEEVSSGGTADVVDTKGDPIEGAGVEIYKTSDGFVTVHMVEGEIQNADFAKSLDEANAKADEILGTKEEPITKPKKTAFGGLWKSGGADEKQNLVMNITHVLSKPTNQGSSYRQMLAHMIKKAEENPDVANKFTVADLKTKLADAYALAGNNLYKQCLDPGTTTEESAALEKKAMSAMAKAKELGYVSPAEKINSAKEQAKKQQPIAGYSHADSPLEINVYLNSDGKKFNVVVNDKATGEILPTSYVVSSPEEAAKKAAEVLLGPKKAKAKDAPKPAEMKTPPPTDAEIEKAKKNVKLQLQYVPGAPAGNAEAQKLVDAFNAEYEGKPLNKKQDLEKKVADFKKMQAAMVPLMSAEQQKQAEAQKAAAEAEAKKEAATKAKAQKEKLKHAEALKEVMTKLGVADPNDAEAFEGFVELAGGNKEAMLAQFKNFEEQGQHHGYPISPFQYAMLQSYTGSSYAAVNKSLRGGSWTMKQHVYVNAVNKALKNMPAYTKTTKRGTDLPANVQALYQVGHVVEERAFTSTSKTKPWGGNTQYVISGKSGRDVSGLSLHGGENEVLYPARTFFKVTKIDGKAGPGNKMTVHLEEVDAL